MSALHVHDLERVLPDKKGRKRGRVADDFGLWRRVRQDTQHALSRVQGLLHQDSQDEPSAEPPTARHNAETFQSTFMKVYTTSFGEDLDSMRKVSCGCRAGI